MSNMKNEKKTPAKKNKLEVPLLISLCCNLALVIALVIVSINLEVRSNSLADAEAQISTANTRAESAEMELEAVRAATEETDTETETEAEDTDETEDEELYFETEDGERVDIEPYDAYVQGSYICVSDGTQWDFSYDEETGENSLIVTDPETEAEDSYVLSIYATEDEDEPRLLTNITGVDSDASVIYYLTNILSDEEEQEVVGILFENAVMDDNNFVLYTPDAYEEYLAQAETADTEAAE